jgi:hypothetical protein
MNYDSIPESIKHILKSVTDKMPAARDENIS